MIKILINLFFMVFAFHFAGFAQLGSIAVNPTRLSFDDQKRREEVEFINLSEDTLSFTVSFKHFRMQENGALELLETPDTSLLIADDYLRIFPRKVTIAPREKQKVSLQYRRNSAMKSGEYRSHLAFSQFIDETKMLAKYEKKDTTSLRTVLLQMFEICVPTIIRTGEIETGSSIENIELIDHDTLQTIAFDINREGNRSLYGNVEIEYQPIDGESYVVGKQKYVGIYPEVNKRQMHLMLRNESNSFFTEGTINIKYLSNDKDNPVTICEKKFNIN